MTTDELLTRLSGRGLELILGPDGRPSLRGPRAEITPPLLKVLKWHRDTLAERLKAETTKKFPPLDRKAFREALEKFWAESGWTPLGGWKPGERDRRDY